MRLQRLFISSTRYISIVIKGMKHDKKQTIASKMPREKLIKYGAQTLSDKELLSIMLGTGIKGKNVFSLAEELLNIIDLDIYGMIPEKLLTISGLGIAKTALIAASFELTRRVLCPKRNKITSPKDILPLIRHYGDREQEHFICLSLNGAHEVKYIRVVSIGLVNRTLVHPREIFSDPLKDRAAAIIIAHNHPSGNLAPSTEDSSITSRIKKAGEILGVPLLDHIIFTGNEYYSFLEDHEL